MEGQTVLKEKFQLVAGKAWDLCVHTRIEMAVGAAIIAIPAAILSYQHEGTKLGQIPLAFSEINSTVNYVENDSGETTPPLTMFYSTVNDAVMQVFEANNAAYTGGEGSNAEFASELDRRFVPRTQADYLIADYAKRVPDYARDARATLAPLLQAYNDLAPVQRALDDAWSASHIDHYKNVTRTRTVCTTSNNKTSCRPQTYIDRVYSYTDHTFRYHPEAGALAARLLNEFAIEHLEVRIPEELIKATRISAENQESIRSSRVNVNDGKEPSNDEYLALTNTWATGSNYERMTPEAYRAHSGVLTMTPAWDKAEDTAKTRYYKTSSRSHSGPEQYQIAEEALSYVEKFRSNTAPVINGIDTAATGIPALEAKIKQYIGVALGEEPGNANALRREIMSDARDIYTSNYVAGFDVNPAKWYMVAIWGLVGMLGGTGFGFGADKLVAIRARRLREDDLRAEEQPEQPKPQPKFGRQP